MYGNDKSILEIVKGIVNDDFSNLLLCLVFCEQIEGSSV